MSEDMQKIMVCMQEAVDTEMERKAKPAYKALLLQTKMTDLKSYLPNILSANAAPRKKLKWLFHNWICSASYLLFGYNSI